MHHLRTGTLLVTTLVSITLFAACGASIAPAPFDCKVVSGLNETQCRQVDGLKISDSIPAARGNKYAQSDPAVLMGFQIFYDARFSGNMNVRCATCHQPEAYFDDAKKVSHGIGDTTRNAPSILDAAWSRWQFWDGRADSLWSQPLIPLEATKEMGFTRLGVAHVIAQSFKADYEKAFGPLPDLSDPTRFPASGKPGDPAWDQMAPADQDTVNRIFANWGKALAAYMRKVAAGPAPLDAFLAGDETALSPEARRGLKVFAASGCLRCHDGPALSDHGFHDIGIPTPDGFAPDPGRSRGRKILAASPFNEHGPYYDGDPPDDPPAPGDDGAAVGAFRTPSLRNVALTAPYGHAGSFATLGDIVDFHLTGGGRGDAGTVGTVDPLLEAHALSDADRTALLTFLTEALTGKYPDPPWNNWPDR